MSPCSGRKGFVKFYPSNKNNMDAPILRHFLRKRETRENYERFPKRCRGGLRRAGQYFDRPERWIGYPPLSPPPHSTRALRSLELFPVLNFPKKCASKINHFRCGRAMSYLLESLFAPFYSSLSLPFALRRNFAPGRRPVGSRSLAIGKCPAAAAAAFQF